MSYKSTVLADSPLAAWTQDHDPGYTDYSGNGRNLGNSSAVTYGGADPGLLPNTCTTYSGSTASNLAAPSWLSAPANFSVECWFKAATAASSGSVLISRDDGNLSPTDARRMFQLTLTSAGKVKFETYNTSGGVATAQTTASTYADNNWHHAVGTYAAGAMVLYIDGQQAGTATQTGTLQSGGTSPLCLADAMLSGSFGGATVSLVGSMCYSAIYGTALSATRVQFHYKAAFAGSLLTTTRAALQRAATR